MVSFHLEVNVCTKDISLEPHEDLAFGGFECQFTKRFVPIYSEVFDLFHRMSKISENTFL